MAIVYVKELFPSRRARDGVDERRDYVRVFEMRTDDPEDRGEIAGTSDDIPRNGDTYPGDDSAIMVEIDVDQSADDSTLWLVTCHYSSDIVEEQGREALNYDSFGTPTENPNSSTGGDSGTPGSGETIQRDPDPRARPPAWSFDWEQTTEVFREDINGDAVVNSSDRPFDPPHTIERSYPVITFTKNVATDSVVLNLLKQKEWQEITNSDTPWGFDAKTLRFARFQSRSAVENGIAYAEVSVTMKVNWKTWVVKILDAGFVDIEGLRVGRDPITGTYPTEPVLLDGTGAELPEGSPPVFVEWEAYRPEDFTPILALFGIAA